MNQVETGAWERSAWLTPLLVGVAILLGLLLLHVGIVGMDTSGDSEAYLDLADDVRDGRWYSDFDTTDTTHFPPAYGTTIGLTSRVLGVSLTTASGLVNAVGWIGTIAGSVALYRSLAGRANGYLWILVLFLATSGLIVDLASSVQTESLFYATCLWFLVLIEAYCKGPSGPLLLAVFAIGAYGFGLRYPGIALIGAGFLRVLQQNSWPWKTRIQRSTVIGLSVLPMLGWYLAVSGDNTGLPGHHERTSARAFEDVWNSLAGLGSWLVAGIPYSEDEELIHSLVDPVARGAAIAAGALLVGGFAYFLWRWLADDLRDGPALAVTADRLRSASMLTVANFVVLYTALVAGFRLRGGGYVLARYWGPVVIVLAVVGLVVASRRATDNTQSGVRLLVLALALIVASNLLVAIGLTLV